MNVPRLRISGAQEYVLHTEQIASLYLFCIIDYKFKLITIFVDEIATALLTVL